MKNDVLSACTLCARNCKVNRHEMNGVCGANDKVKLAHYSLHMWEEPVISGDAGSGTVFFSNCNLKCIFCQNSDISFDGYGKEISNEKLSEIFLKLQDMGANNINLVTPTHYVPQIIDALDMSKEKLNIPVVYNTSSYENVDTIKMLDGYVDVYLADLKYFNDALGCNYSNVNNYFDVASRAIDEMYNQVGAPVFENDLMKKGVIVRVLVLPEHADDAKKIIEYLYNKYHDNIFISIMNQYTPIKKFDNYKNLNRKITDEEYDDVINYAVDLGVVNAFVQEGETQSESFIPKWNSDNI